MLPQVLLQMKLQSGCSQLNGKCHIHMKMKQSFRLTVFTIFSAKVASNETISLEAATAVVANCVETIAEVPTDPLHTLINIWGEGRMRHWRSFDRDTFAIPLHFRPLPVKPILQMHSKLPSVLKQSPFLSQISWLHSSTSESVNFRLLNWLPLNYLRSLLKGSTVILTFAWRSFMYVAFVAIASSCSEAVITTSDICF